ncbi:presequence protease, mitochondrial isoform X1 [Nematostella vectensis]|uniref:presequence protease, mitochondrial isoform X1 n=1 Tax=Nematostella vectensis TaxID=45351 RepID=UPI00138FE2B9|nr:presequence protease, mitochondrial isoform X1 [Nematostella vectensis]
MWRVLRGIVPRPSTLGFSLRNFRSGERLLCANPEAEQPPKTSSVLETAGQLKAGDNLHGYTVTKVVPIQELSLVSVELIHDATGAQHLHIARDDSNNVFGVGLRTTPLDSTGVPHILEHTALCGSEKFPCRDPFFKMLNRSLATFMNAFTASDFTMYPFSTQNSKDYFNLLSIYLDAVFFPRLRELDFWQEGWRMENEDLSASSSALTFKGVVFNEMKGALSTPESVFVTQAQKLLLPSHTYSHISGGDPLHIPDLTWEQLKKFHATHYHPSNARFYTYGDIPLEEHLQHISSLALQRFDKLQTETEIPHEERWSEAREAHVTCPIDPMAADPDKQTTVSRSYLVASTTDPFESFILGILSSLLIGGPTSPFYQALIEPNIGSDFSPGVGYDNGTKDASFSIGLQGIKKEDVEKVKEIIKTTFDKVVEEGFPKERIASILHRVELSVKHQSSNFGLGLMMSLMHPWTHGGDPTEYLQINKYMEKFKACMEEDEKFLENKVREYFVDNTHNLTLVMSPDAEYEAKLAKLEKAKLEKMTSSLTDDDKENIYKKCLELASQQNTTEDLSCLPVMHISDIDPKIKRVVLDECIVAGVPAQFSEQPTNSVTYFRAISSTTDIPDELHPYLPLFCYVITKMGAGNLDYKEMAQLIERRTGGLSVGTHICTNHTDPMKYEQGVMFSSHCLDKNLPHMFYLWGEIFGSPRFKDQERLRTLINMLASDLASSIAQSGHSYAVSLASSSLTPAARLDEVLGGLSQVVFMKQLVDAEDLSPVIEKLTTIAVHVLEGTQFRCAVNTMPETRSSTQTALEGFCDALPSSRSDTSGQVQDKEFTPESRRTHFMLPYPVNYASRCVNAVTYNHEDYAKLRILAKLLSSKFLHREIREKGGAYGSGAKLGGGVFSFFSYRDPNSVGTLDAFNDSISWASQGNFTDQDINEAKLAVFAAVDSPVSPSNRGMLYFTQGITDAMRQAQRDRLFAVSRDDIVNVTRKYLSSSEATNSYALVGPENDVIDKDDSWTVRKESL